MAKYLIVKESVGGYESIYHTDKRFYDAFISTRGCDFVVYKRKGSAEKTAARLQKAYPDCKVYPKEMGT
jgi:hypothetical protein